jgi:hypothetical protein
MDLVFATNVLNMREIVLMEMERNGYRLLPTMVGTE